MEPIIKTQFHTWSLSDPGVTQYRHVSEADKNPNEMIPLMPGESMHIGYEPISEEDAFLNIKRDEFRVVYSFCKLKSFQIKRGDISCDRLAQLIRKFNCLNWGVQTIIPKSEELNSFAQKFIYNSMVDFKTFRGKRATMSIVVRPIIKRTEDLESGVVHQFVEVEIFRLSGSIQVFQLYSDSLEDYIRSDGIKSAFILQTVENTTHWANPPVYKKHKTIDDSDSESSLDGEMGCVKPFRRATESDDELSPKPRPLISIKMQTQEATWIPTSFGNDAN
jgi:hypothetical protein